MAQRREAGSRGYLDQDFRLVRLKDSLAQRIDLHYHAFDKLVFFLGGRAAYTVEGQTYPLQPWDIVLVPHHTVHRPVIDGREPYERVVLWLGGEWLAGRRDPGEALDACLTHSRETGVHLLRIQGEARLTYARILRSLEEALASDAFGARRMADTVCQQLLIQVSRDSLRLGAAPPPEGLAGERLAEIRRYIAAHLEEDLSVDALSGRFFLSRYHLMRRFKAATGCSLHQYVVHKRLLRAGELIRQGVPVMEAARRAGFTEYSSFLRSFRGAFHTSPRQLKQSGRPGGPADRGRPVP